MKANAPEKLYYAPYGDIREDYPITDNDIEYTRTDAFVEKAAVEWFNSVKYKSDLSGTPINAFKAGAQWKKEHLWKPADGDDLPEYDREVMVLVKYSTQRNIHDKEYSTYRVGFGHRPNPYGWDGKSITTGNVEHYTPKLYDKGGWNIPDVKWWLDVELPKEIEL